MSNSAFTPSTNYANAATPSNEGLVNTGAQTFGGDKTFNGNVTVNGALSAASGQSAIISGTPSGTIYTGADNVLVLVVASFYSGSQAGSHNMSIVNFRNVSGTPTLYIHTVASNFITVTQVAGTFGIQLQTTNGSTTTTNWSVTRLR